MSPPPLEGTIVCDFTVALAGPTATIALSQLGARVIKIERPSDPERLKPLTLGAPADVDRSWAARMGGKESVTVDARTTEGQAVIRRLIARCDVLAESLGPGAMNRLGLDYDSVREMNPRIIYASLKGFRPDSQWSTFRAYDPQVQAMSGVMSVTGQTKGPPTRPGPPIGDIGAGVALALGIIAALVERQATGEGQQVSVSMHDCAMHFMRPYFAANIMTGAAPRRNGNLDPDPASTGYCGMFACRGRETNDYCVLELDTDEEWRTLVAVTGMTAVGNDRRFRTQELRRANAPALDTALAPWFAKRTKRDAMRFLVSSGIRAAAVLTARDVMQDGALWAPDTFSSMELPDGGCLKTLAWPVKFGSFSPALTVGPSLGEHTDDVMRELLDYSDQDVAALHRAGVI